MGDWMIEEDGRDTRNRCPNCTKGIRFKVPGLKSTRMVYPNGKPVRTGWATAPLCWDCFCGWYPNKTQEDLEAFVQLAAEQRLMIKEIEVRRDTATGGVT
jgi:hypothetical protein